MCASKPTAASVRAHNDSARDRAKEHRMDTKQDYRASLQAARKAISKAASQGTKQLAGACDALRASMQNAWAQIKTPFGK
jgi:hypothetical protein